MASISTLNVQLTANISRFASGMGIAARTLGAIRTQYAKATDSAAAYDRMAESIGEVKLAGGETIAAMRNTLAVARSELRRFADNTDVKVAVEIGREYLDESWIKARAYLEGVSRRAGINVAARVVAAKSGDVSDWIARQRRAAGKQITVRMELARRGIDMQLAAVRAKLEPLRQYRAVRIGIAAVNATKLPAQAALATLTPLRRLAVRGVVVGLRATHFGVTAGVTKAKAALTSFASAGVGMAGQLAGGFLAVGAAVAGIGVAGLTALVHSSMDSMDAMNDQAVALGVSTKALSQLSYAAKLAGSDHETLAGGLTKMSNNLSDAATKGGPAAAALRTIGLNAKALVNLSPDEAFLKIATGMAGIQNPAQKTALAMDLFGKSGAAMVPMLNEGEAGLRSLMAEADALGASFDAVEANKIAAANDAIDRAKTAIGGVGNTLAVQLAPYIEQAATWFTELATSGEGVGPKVVGAFQSVVGTVAYLSDYLSLGVATFKLFQSGATAAVSGVVTAIDYLGQGVVSLLNLLPGVDLEWGSFTGDLAKGLREEAGNLFVAAGEAMDDFARGKNQKAVEQWFSGVAKSADAAAKEAAGKQISGPTIKPVIDTAAVEKVKDSLADLTADLARVGLSDSQTKLADLADAGATTEQLSTAREMLALRDRLGKLGTVEGRDPFADYAAKADELRQLAAAGKITADQLKAIGDSAAMSLAGAVKIDGADASAEYAAVMERMQKLYAAGKLTAEQFAAIRKNAQQSLTDALGEEAKRLTESVRTPLEEYQAEVARMNDMLQRGLITQETFDRAALKAREGVSAASPVEVKAVSARSVEGQALAYDRARGVQRMGRDDYGKQQLAKTEAGNRQLEQIARNTAGNKVPVIELA